MDEVSSKAIRIIICTLAILYVVSYAIHKYVVPLNFFH